MPRLFACAFSLKKRIAFGYLLNGAMVCAIVLLSWGTFERFTADLNKIVYFSHQAADSITFAAQMAEMQREALIYMYEGHGSASDQVSMMYRQMNKSIAQENGLRLSGSYLPS